jgi:DNA (cytosine-5)-methyltransferase 1
MVMQYGVVDLFAGPGGLAEGFSSVTDDEGTRPFRIALSVEKEKSAHATLRLRAFVRQFADTPPDEYVAYLAGGDQPDWGALYPDQWAAACTEALCLELGTPAAEKAVDERISAIHDVYGDRTILIGGPPCQAYSLVGRARNQGIVGYKPSGDNRHFLYREYIRILTALRPAVFIMENVKGMLSAKVDGVSIFQQVIADLEAADPDHGYELIAIAPEGKRLQNGRTGSFKPEDFVVRAERFGLPQARHRVIILGVRADHIGVVAKAQSGLFRLARSSTEIVPVEAVLEGLPEVRSGFSSGRDTGADWAAFMRACCEEIATGPTLLTNNEDTQFREAARRYHSLFGYGVAPTERSASTVGVLESCPDELRDWLDSSGNTQLRNHESRSHMASDLKRYLFAAIYAEVLGRSPKAFEFPEQLAPKHQNWSSGKFKDRFRVQLRGRPSSTVTSHISKDGHYFIHPDPLQCRSLTVREAARLQTFPDNYVFLGSRTEQFVQVGNAVPPFLALQIGTLLRDLLDTTPISTRRPERSTVTQQPAGQFAFV